MFWSVRAGANLFSVKAPCRGADIAPPSGRVTPEILAALTAERSIAAPADLRYGIFFATSDNRWGYRDLAHARSLLGFIPEDRAEAHR